MTYKLFFCKLYNCIFKRLYSFCPGKKKHLFTWNLYLNNLQTFCLNQYCIFLKIQLCSHKIAYFFFQFCGAQHRNKPRFCVFPYKQAALRIDNHLLTRKQMSVGRIWFHRNGQNKNVQGSLYKTGLVSGRDHGSD